jgi:hypothetical protein
MGFARPRACPVDTDRVPAICRDGACLAVVEERARGRLLISICSDTSIWVVPTFIVCETAVSRGEIAVRVDRSSRSLRRQAGASVLEALSIFSLAAGRGGVCGCVAAIDFGGLFALAV